jgi:hypothetical protein
MPFVLTKKNEDEKRHHIQCMRKIYTKASRVLVWNGEARSEGSQTLEKIFEVAQQQHSPSQTQPREHCFPHNRRTFGPICVTISKDHTGGDRQRRSELLAIYGAKISRHGAQRAQNSRPDLLDLQTTHHPPERGCRSTATRHLTRMRQARFQWTVPTTGITGTTGGQWSR